MHGLAQELWKQNLQQNLKSRTSFWFVTSEKTAGFWENGNERLASNICWSHVFGFVCPGEQLHLQPKAAKNRTAMSVFLTAESSDTVSPLVLGNLPLSGKQPIPKRQRKFQTREQEGGKPTVNSLYSVAVWSLRFCESKSPTSYPDQRFESHSNHFLDIASSITAMQLSAPHCFASFRYSSVAKSTPCDARNGNISSRPQAIACPAGL